MNKFNLHKLFKIFFSYTTGAVNIRCFCSMVKRRKSLYIFIQCIDFWTKFPYCSPLSWILKIYWGSAIPENKDFSCLYICLFPFISCENALELKKSSIARVKLDSSFCVLMSPWRWQQEKFIKWYSMHLSDLVRLNSTTTTKKFSLWKGHCWF